MCIIAKNKCNEKKIDSKVGYLSGTKQCNSPVRETKQVISEPVLPSSSDNLNDEIQVALRVFSIFIHTLGSTKTTTAMAEQQIQVVL
jgi:hypothetical protein